MGKMKVFLVHLRRPVSASRNPNEQRDDPFYEFGSFGCTGCHSSNLLHPRHVDELEGSRLGFVQGGKSGSKLVYLTPPIHITVWGNRCEARWAPAEMPFKYAHAPVLVCNDGRSDFPLIEKLAASTANPTLEAGLCSRLRSRAKALEPELGKQVMAVYRKKRARTAPSAIAVTYEETLPYPPPKIDRNRKATYDRYVEMLVGKTRGAKKCKASKPRRKSTCTKPKCCRAKLPAKGACAKSKGGKSRRKGC